MKDCTITAECCNEVDFGVCVQGRGGEGEYRESEVVLKLLGEIGFKDESERGVGALDMSVVGCFSATPHRT